MLPELQHEVRIYKLLSDLQGKCIPRLVLNGYWEGGTYCIGLSLCGTVPKFLSDSQKDEVVKIFEEIHKRGVVHNDFKKENILVDKHGKVYLTGFGFSIVDATEEEKEHEMRQVMLALPSL